MTWRSRRHNLQAVTVFVAIVLLLAYLRGFGSNPTASAFPVQKPFHRPPLANTPKPTLKLGDDDVEMVVASMKKENITWLHDYLPDWEKSIYVVDDPSAQHTVSKNKGREAMVFLSYVAFCRIGLKLMIDPLLLYRYIIDRYDSLPGNIIFHHAERFQWHNDNPDYDALPLLQRFRIEHLKEEGYVNLRCAWVLGCPAEIHPSADDVQPAADEPVHAKHVYKGAFQQLFPGTPVPDTIGVPCCSQFAVRRDTIRQRPRLEYVRYRDWLRGSSLGDDLSGRVLEYSWHIIFGKKSVHCPNAAECYCKTYGLCDMQCDQDKCGSQYILPPFATLPQGWPRLGWEHEDRHWSGPP
ncbi:hypothetical protein S7711_05128 [Stachybotrys chartarum IBT 7711]|uniref:Uncharacterized protein n=1 Tax=Stachybotrys chartarum (strain CBS 109288 / IBT 7711) TaxID=1280523 RepID=A0A084B4H4_STACB|nr:hypothetical protein S7711_05128 [Stachybotrys chartarum IBT 7711]KFA48332.1 hypothetical protein S40293_04480 [Stachybotrys chartarum IBT 40293]